jgi:hypothetical protein
VTGVTLLARVELDIGTELARLIKVCLIETYGRVQVSGFSGLAVSMLAPGIQVRGFEPGQSRRIFQGEKILGMPSFGGELKLSRGTRYLKAKLTGHFLTIFPPFPARGLLRYHRCGVSWRYKRELPKPGSYNKLAGCITSGGTSHRGQE